MPVSTSAINEDLAILTWFSHQPQPLAIECLVDSRVAKRLLTMLANIKWGLLLYDEYMAIGSAKEVQYMAFQVKPVCSRNGDCLHFNT